MRLPALLTALALCLPLYANAAKLNTQETSLADIRQYQTQLQQEVQSGRLKSVPAATKTALKRRSDELSELMKSPTAVTSDTELARIGELYVKFQDAAEKAALQVVQCRRTASVGSRLGNRVCITAADAQAQRDEGRKQVEDVNWNNVPPPGE